MKQAVDRWDWLPLSGVNCVGIDSGQSAWGSGRWPQWHLWPPKTWKYLFLFNRLYQHTRAWSIAAASFAPNGTGVTQSAPEPLARMRRPPLWVDPAPGDRVNPPFTPYAQHA